MWSIVAPADIKSEVPSARSKHSATVVGENVYLFGGRNGNLPTRDFWKYNLVSGEWQKLNPKGLKLPSLQEHTSVAYKECLYFFGGEVGFSAGTETPLWIYEITTNTWKKVGTKKGVLSPTGRRGHSALIYKESMLIYGGYQDLRGSSNELWSYNFETELWHLAYSSPYKNDLSSPPPRHKHSAILHQDAMWIYGGMTDLQERSDLWKWDIRYKKWSNYKSKINPGPLHSHAACNMPSYMILFGGERNGQACNNLWKFSFTTETWENIVISGLKPQPRAESVAFAVSEFMLENPGSINMKALQTRRACKLMNYSSHFPTNRVAPFDETYVQKAPGINYVDNNINNDIAYHCAKYNRTFPCNFFHGISKLSQINITGINKKCSYTILTSVPTESTESLLKQNFGLSKENVKVGLMTPVKMVKSKSSDGINTFQDDELMEVTSKKKIDSDNNDALIKGVSREPISIPNFNIFALPSPVLSSVEVTKLDYLSDDENDCAIDLYKKRDDKKSEENKLNKILVKDRSYNSHLSYNDNELDKEGTLSLQDIFTENVCSTSDHASIETINELYSNRNYSRKINSTDFVIDNNKNNEDSIFTDTKESFGFCNPNYLSRFKKPISFKDGETKEFKENNCNEDFLEIKELNGFINGDSKVFFKNNTGGNTTSHSLIYSNLNCTENVPKLDKCKTLTTNNTKQNSKRNIQDNTANSLEEIKPYTPFNIYIMGGKEQGQVTVFQRPLSIWKLELF